jgi:small multidrug resistance family-3 protein
MNVFKTFAIYVLAALGELGGTYCYWRWLREGGPASLAVVGILVLLGYAVIQTFQPESRYGRVYAAYAGIFLVGAMLWGRLIDGTAPDRFDIIGGAIALVGVVVVLYGRVMFAHFSPAVVVDEPLSAIADDPVPESEED